MRLFIIIIIGTLLLINTSCTESNTIEELRTAEILRTLSEDKMKGRFALSSEIKLAENFISNHFKSAGLRALNKNSFHQYFTLSTSYIESSKITIDGKLIDENKYLAFSIAEIFQSSTKDIPTYFIRKKENFWFKFHEYKSLNNDAIILIDPAFKDLFKRYKIFYGNEHRFLKENKNGTIVFIVANANIEDVEIEITSKIEEQSIANIVGVIDGERKDEFVIFSAHHDHIGIQTAIGADSIANGANDNGSGVTAVIQLAKHFASKEQPKRTLIFATFTAEEFGGYGSQYFSKQYNPDEIIAMFNIEMIGKPALSGPNSAWITGYERSTFGQILTESTTGTNFKFYPDPYPNQNLFYRSDNATLARLGVPAHSICTTPIDVDTDYHQVSDEFNTIDINHLNNTIKAIANASEGIISGEHTPSRVNVSLLD